MGRETLQTLPEITAHYAGAGWRPPVSFAWQDLSYEVLGPDAVLVVGRLDWGAQPQQPPLRVSYTAVLRRREGGLRIRLEDESVDPSSLPKPASSRAAPRAGAPHPPDRASGAAGRQRPGGGRRGRRAPPARPGIRLESPSRREARGPAARLPPRGPPD
jgi:hypothetical protein